MQMDKSNPETKAYFTAIGQYLLDQCGGNEDKACEVVKLVRYLAMKYLLSTITADYKISAEDYHAALNEPQDEIL